MSQPTVADAFENFVLAKDSKNVVPSTMYLYNWSFKFWESRWPDLKLFDVTAQHVRAWLLWMQGREEQGGVPPPESDRGGPLSSSSVNIAYRNLRTFYRWCEREDLIRRSPFGNVEAPKVEERLPDYLTPDEANTLLNAVRRNGDRNAFRDYVIHLAFMSTGIRLAELAGLNVEHLHLREGWAKVFGKGRRERIVSLGKTLPAELKRYVIKYRHAPEGEPGLFLNEQGRRLGSRGLQSIIIRDITTYVPRPIVRLGPHTYRHTFITFRLRETRDLKGTSLAAGHKDTRTTERYAHLALDDVMLDGEGKPYSPMDNIVRKNGGLKG